LFNKATARLTVGKDIVETFGYAELSEHKGMSPEQANGSASSYSRKYALNGLFLIDETEADADSQAPQQAKKEPAKQPDGPMDGVSALEEAMHKQEQEDDADLKALKEKLKALST
jgi:hypothetical protein